MTASRSYQTRDQLFLWWVADLSANVALKAAGETLGYPELTQLLRRGGTVKGDRNTLRCASCSGAWCLTS